jgi:hypothetical protein
MFQEKSKPLKKLLRIKQFDKSSYTIPKGPLDERCGERVKVKKMLLYAKQDSSLDENH